MDVALPKEILKPLLRGHFHQAAFFFALGACAMLIANAPAAAVGVALVYSLSLVCMFGISALYHRPRWDAGKRALLKRMDHAAIFVLIAGTGTPVSWLALEPAAGSRMLAAIWTTAGAGIIQSVFWPRAPKWISIGLYILCGWIAAPYIPEIGRALGTADVRLLIAGGLVYTVGALIYAFKRPDPYPRVFGYHEVFHLLVIAGAILHFIVIARLVS
jgi:hemolysin III